MHSQPPPFIMNYMIGFCEAGQGVEDAVLLRFVEGLIRRSGDSGYRCDHQSTGPMHQLHISLGDEQIADMQLIAGASSGYVQIFQGAQGQEFHKFLSAIIAESGFSLFDEASAISPLKNVRGGSVTGRVSDSGKGRA